MVRTPDKKAARKTKKQAGKKANPDSPKRKPGRPKDSRKKKQGRSYAQSRVAAYPVDVAKLPEHHSEHNPPAYLVFDDHFGNHPVFHMVRHCQLHLISKLRYDAALHFAYAGPSPKRGLSSRLGEQVDVRNIPDQFLKETQIEGGFETRTYQLQLLHKDFLEPQNVVILLRTNLETHAWANGVLFSSDLDLPYDF